MKLLLLITILLSINVIFSGIGSGVSSSAMMSSTMATGSGAANPPWGYGHGLPPQDWYMDYPLCGTGLAVERQSPIDVVGSAIDETLKLTFTYNKQSTYSTLNNGHTFQVNVLSENPSVNFKGVDYNLAQFHFHWKKDSTTSGSEHHVNGQSYPLEVHFVHFNSKYASLGDAADKSDGLLVIGRFFSLSSGHAIHPSLASVFATVPNYITPQENAGNGTIDFNNVLTNNETKFYNYPGSLTTPPCFQSVNWIVLHEVLKIEQSVLDAFYLLEDSNGDFVHYNNRPLQAVNDRTITASWDASKTTSDISKLDISVLVILMISILSLLF